MSTWGKLWGTFTKVSLKIITPLESNVYTLCQITVPRNFDPSLHPFEVQREYVKALNAVKLERVFAKPFVGNLDGHSDGVSCMSKHPNRLSLLLSAAYDGEVSIIEHSVANNIHICVTFCALFTSATISRWSCGI